MNEDDQQLVAAVLASEPRAFERLVLAHQRLVWHLVHRMVDHAEDTRELSQEVFLRVHRQLPRFRFEAALGTWIGRIAFSVAARHLRRRRLPLVAPDQHEGDGDPLARIADDTNLEQAQLDADAMTHLAAAMATLAPLPRTLVTLYHLDELGIPEIAAITELPIGTIKSHLFRARRQLRAQLVHLQGDQP